MHQDIATVLCPHCGEMLPYRYEDRFCTRCGAPLPTAARSGRHNQVLVLSRSALARLMASGPTPCRNGACLTAPMVGAPPASPAPQPATAGLPSGPQSGDRIALAFRLAGARAADRRLCQTCGSALRETARFCVQCGSACTVPSR